MIKDVINIGIPSKGRLRKDVLNIFKKKKLKLVSERGERDLFGSIKNKKNIKVVYLHAREIIQRLGDGSLDLGFSGFDLLKESEINIQNKVNVTKKYNFGKATLVVAIPDEWIDVQTIADLEEIAFEFKDKKKKRLRVGTKYPNLTRDFLFSKGVTQFKLVDSLGATEETLRANNLRILKDGEILKSEACMMISKSSSKNRNLQSLVKLLSKN
jgi:ATP phosphoribosyltransferase